MKREFALSAGLHGALLAGLLITWPQMTRQTDPFNEPITVDILDVDTITRVNEVQQPSVEAAPRETQPDDAGATDPQINPEPLPEAALSDVPPPSQTKAEQAQRLNPKQLATLLDKSIRESQTKTRDFSQLAKDVEKLAPRDAVLSPQQTITLRQLVESQIQRCWNIPVGIADLTAMRIQIRFRLNQDGSLNGPPEILGQQGERLSGFAAFRDSAIRAVRMCAPFRLPPEWYGQWQVIDYTFNPSQIT
jgi:hypothetical protein